jgi:hypothetical protein
MSVFSSDRQRDEVINATQYLGELNKRDALKILFPLGEDLKERLAFITKLRGRHPSLYTLYQAAVEWEGWLAMEYKRKIEWERLDPIYFIASFAPSINGWRSNQAVEIAKTESVAQPHSILDMLKGNKK